MSGCRIGVNLFSSEKKAEKFRLGLDSCDMLTMYMGQVCPVCIVSIFDGGNQIMIRIISDSTCDLSEELLKQYDIDIIPLQILLGDQNYEDGCGITPDEIYRWSDENKSSPKTAACTQTRCEDIFMRHIDRGDEVICFSISESMSCTAGVMRMAAEAIGAADRVSVVNSQNLSTGVGLLVLAAADMARSGMDRAAIVAEIEQLIPRVRASFVVDTLTYLHRGGRCSGVAALFGSTLRMHPLISVTGGKMEPGKKYRGRMNRVIDAYVEDLLPAIRNADSKRVFITHSGCDEAVIAAVYDKVKALGRFREIHVTRAGGVISSHCGPGTLGVLFIGQK